MILGSSPLLVVNGVNTSSTHGFASEMQSNGQVSVKVICLYNNK